MTNELIQKILKGKGIFIFLLAAVIIAVIFRGKGGGKDITLTDSADPEITQASVVTEENPAVISGENLSQTTAPEVTVSAETTTEQEQEPETTTAASQSPSQEWVETPMAPTTMYISWDSISSRKKPIQGSTKVNTYAKDQKVTVVASTNTDYYKIKDGSFIHKDYLTEKKPNEVVSGKPWKETTVNSVTMYVTKDGIYSREKPIQGSDKLDKYSKNQKVTVIAETDTDYCKIEEGGYIHQDYLTDKAPENESGDNNPWKETAVNSVMYVNKNNIYSREKPIQGSAKKNTYKLDQKVYVTAKTDTDYYKVGENEYIHMDYLTDKAPEDDVSLNDPNNPWKETAMTPTVMYVNKAGISSREKPIQGSTKKTKYSLNQSVTVTAETDTDYYKLEDGTFIHKDYLSKEKTDEISLRSYSAAYSQRAQEQWELDYSNQVFDITNQIRAEHGLSPLEKLDSLTAAAVARAWESTVKNSHTRPDGTSCFTVLPEYGLKMSHRGENLAVWSSTPEKVVNSWMNDAPHRKILLDPDYKYLGVGFFYVPNDPKGNYYYWEQLYYAP